MKNTRVRTKTFKSKRQDISNEEYEEERRSNDDKEEEVVEEHVHEKSYGYINHTEFDKLRRKLQGDQK